MLARPSYQALAELWDRWLKSVSYDELSRIEAIRGQRELGTLTAAARRRAAVADGVAAEEPGIWIDVDALFAILQAPPAPLVVARTRWPGGGSTWSIHITGRSGPSACRPGMCSKAGMRCACFSSTRPRWA